MIDLIYELALKVGLTAVFGSVAIALILSLFSAPRS